MPTRGCPPNRPNLIGDLRRQIVMGTGGGERVAKRVFGDLLDLFHSVRGQGVLPKMFI
jgi:hypothetical protein